MLTPDRFFPLETWNLIVLYRQLSPEAWPSRVTQRTNALRDTTDPLVPVPTPNQKMRKKHTLAARTQLAEAERMQHASGCGRVSPKSEPVTPKKTGKLTHPPWETSATSMQPKVFSWHMPHGNPSSGETDKDFFVTAWWALFFCVAAWRAVSL